MLQDIRQEIKTVAGGSGSRFFDSIFPTLAFLIGIAFIETRTALLISMLLSAGLFVFRLLTGRPLVYALGGIGGAAVAAVFVLGTGRQAGFFVPGLITSGLLVLLSILSLAVNRPLVAMTSQFTRRWPGEWYRHPRVSSAYNEVTLFWAIAFSIRLVLDYWLFEQNAVEALGFVRIMMGTPYTLALLIFSYLYGRARLQRLGGPSVEEFKAGKGPPWQSQQAGF